jgi:acyl carrier protein
VTDEGEIRASVLRALHQVAPDVDIAHLDPARDLRRQADLDSVDLLRFVVALHDELGIEVPDEDYEELDTLDRAVAYLGARLGRG